MNPIQPDTTGIKSRNTLTFGHLSIQQRLPLFIFILLLTVVLAFSWISYISVKNASMAIGAERVTTLADKLSLMFKGSVDQFAGSMRAIAAQKPVKDILVRGKGDV